MPKRASSVRAAWAMISIAECGLPLCLFLMHSSKKRSSKRIHKIFELVPSGVGRGQRAMRGLSEQDYEELLKKGARWSIEKGYGFPIDLEHMESNGCIEDADPSEVSSVAKSRGQQLGASARETTLSKSAKCRRFTSRHCACLEGRRGPHLRAHSFRLEWIWPSGLSRPQPLRAARI